MGDYNDDAILPRYVSSSSTYADEKRKGIQEERIDTASILEHAQEALGSPFPPSHSRRRYPFRYRSP